MRIRLPERGSASDEAAEAASAAAGAAAGGADSAAEWAIEEVPGAGRLQAPDTRLHPGKPSS